MCADVASPQSLAVELVTANGRDKLFFIARIFLRASRDIEDRRLLNTSVSLCLCGP